MIFRVSKTSDLCSGRNNRVEVELNTLEEFVAWCREQERERKTAKPDWPDYDGIIVLPDDGTGSLELEIYDDYRE